MEGEERNTKTEKGRMYIILSDLVSSLGTSAIVQKTLSSLLDATYTQQYRAGGVQQEV